MAFVIPVFSCPLKSGDLLFQIEGNSSFSEAISSATAARDSLKFVHVGIVEMAGDTASVIEASPEEGVRIVPLDTFLNSSALQGGRSAVVAKRLTIDFPVADALSRAREYLGQPYDWWYLPDNEKMYCSELVYESFRDADGNRIFEANPMNFRAPDGSIHEFWVRLYTELGMDVPEGVPGTNPADMARDSRLVEVFRFF